MIPFLDDDSLLTRVEFVFAAVFIVANIVVGRRLLRAWRLRHQAVLTWPAPRPPYYGLMLVIGLVLGLLVLVNVFWLRRSASHWFWELMMVAYYGYLFPLSTQIRQGFYEDGVWAGPGFVRYADIGSLTWREDAQIVLLLVPREGEPWRGASSCRSSSTRKARRLLRDSIQAQQILLSRPGLDLFGHDEREDV